MKRKTDNGELEFKQNKSPKNDPQKKFETREELYEYFEDMCRSGWPKKGRSKTLDDASVCALLCSCRMLLPKEIVELLFRHARAGPILMEQLQEMLDNRDVKNVLEARHLKYLMMEHGGLFDYLCSVKDDEMHAVGKLLQFVVLEDEEADKKAMMYNRPWGDVVKCFRAARWYARKHQYPKEKDQGMVWMYWISFNPVITAPINKKNQWSVVRGINLDMLKRVITLPYWDLNVSLLASCLEGMVKHVALLLEHGANVNAREHGNETALMVSIRKGHKRVVELLVAHRADVNMEKRHHVRALDCALVRRSKEITEILLKAGADPNYIGHRGLTPLQLAIFYDFPEIVNMLLKYGADVNAKDQCGHTTLDLALDWEEYEYADLIHMEEDVQW